MARIYRLTGFLENNIFIITEYLLVSSRYMDDIEGCIAYEELMLNGHCTSNDYAGYINIDFHGFKKETTYNESLIRIVSQIKYSIRQEKLDKLLQE